eukprot:NODE_797_length_3840_cov_0.211708.p2 type:complete len:223 gc:universal NODE_797_length_3840_cov_0.211708:1842-2510(+)
MFFSIVILALSISKTDPIVTISQPCQIAIGEFTTCLQKFNDNFFIPIEGDQCTSCASSYKSYQLACASEIAAKNYIVFAYDVICHQEKGIYCNNQISQTQVTFNCKNACHQYAANFILNAPQGMGFMYTKSAKIIKNGNELKPSVYTKYWDLDQMAKCVDDKCTESSWQYYSCINSKKSLGVSKMCKMCDASNYHKYCKSSKFMTWSDTTHMLNLCSTYKNK